MANKDTSKGWFETGDYPTQIQFHQVFDWLRWGDVLIGPDDLTPELLALINSYGRTVQLPDGTVQYTARAGTLIEKFFLGEQPDTLHVGAVLLYTFRIGLTPGGDELLADTVVDIDDPNSGIIGLDHYCLVETTIYFTSTPTVGEPNKPLIKIYKS